MECDPLRSEIHTAQMVLDAFWSDADAFRLVLVTLGSVADTWKVSADTLHVSLHFARSRKTMIEGLPTGV